jgi:branched-chain amino acid transport system substrate-binding protein
VPRLLPLFFFVSVLLIRTGEAQPLVIGAVAPLSGAHAPIADDYRKALILWAEETNAAGGLLGREVELRLLDDGSEAVKSGALYRELIEGKADALIGPYGTAATLMAAAEAESARRVMVNGAGWSREIHKRAPRFVFQSAIPYQAYASGILEIAKALGYRTLFILARDEFAAREMAAGARDAALKLGLAGGEVLVYPGGTEDFAPQIAKARAANADAWIAFGEARDAAEMVKSFKKAGYAPRLFAARGIAEPGFIAHVGQDAEFVLGPKAYDARFATPANEQFVTAFRARWGMRPGAAGAEGYAAATVLAEGLRRAGSADQEKLRAALATLVTWTVLGEFRVDPATGEQAAEQAVLVQIQKGRAEIVWPQTLATAKWVLPYPPWGERQLLKK